MVTASCPQGSALRIRQSVCDTLETAHLGYFMGFVPYFMVCTRLSIDTHKGIVFKQPLVKQRTIKLFSNLIQQGV